MRNRFNINEQEKNRIRDLHGIQVINEQDSGADGPTEKDREELIKCLKTYKIDSSNYNKIASNTERRIEDNQKRYPDLNVHRMWMVRMLGDLTINAEWSGGKPEWLDELTKHVWCERQKGGGEEPNRKAEREQSCIYKIISRFPRVIKNFNSMCE